MDSNVSTVYRGGDRILDYDGLNPRVDIKDFGLVEKLRGQGVGTAWYKDYIEPYLINCGFKILAVYGDCLDSGDVLKFWRGQGFDHQFALTKLGVVDDRVEYIVLKKI